jgi:hypothetical protein
MLLKREKPLHVLQDEAIRDLKDVAYSHITESLPIHKQLNMMERYVDLMSKNVKDFLTTPEQEELDTIKEQLDWKNTIIDEVNNAEYAINRSQTKQTMRNIKEVAMQTLPLNPKVLNNGNKQR